MATITIQQINDYAKRNRRIKLLTDAQKDAKEEIVKALNAGATLPVTGPYVIDLSPNGGKDFSWEEEYARLKIQTLKADGYTQKEASALCASEMKELKENAPEKKAEKVGDVEYVGGVKFLVRPSASYKAEAA